MHSGAIRQYYAAVERVSVIGFGRFGRFWSELLARRYEVVATSRRAIDDLPAGVRQVDLDEAAAAPIVFLCVAISAFEPVVRRLAPLIADGVTLVDTFSVKLHPSTVMERLVPPRSGLIATHPMFGPDSATKRADRPPIVTWPLRDPHRRYDALCHAFDRLGLRVVEMTPDRHDAEAARTQGVTHLIGRALAQLRMDRSPIATLGYERLVSVMEQTNNDPLQLFLDLQRYNPYTKRMRTELKRAFDAVESSLNDGVDPPNPAW